MDAVVLVCGDAPAIDGSTGMSIVTVAALPDKDELAPVLSSLDGRRLVVVGTDAALAAVVLRLLRTERVPEVPVGFVAVGRSAFAVRWGLPTAPAGAWECALHGRPDPVPLIRDDAGGVLLGLGVIKPVRGVAYCDDELVLRGQASRIEVVPDPHLGLATRVVRLGLLGKRVKETTGRAMQLGCVPTTVWCDAVRRRTQGDRWTWYRATTDLRLCREWG